MKQTVHLTLASLLVAIEEIVRLLLAWPLKVQREDDHRWGQGGEDKSAVVNAECLQEWKSNVDKTMTSASTDHSQSIKQLLLC